MESRPDDTSTFWQGLEVDVREKKRAALYHLISKSKYIFKLYYFIQHSLVFFDLLKLTFGFKNLKVAHRHK